MNRFLAHFICAFVPVKKYRKALRDYLYSFDFAKISYKVREFRSLENETQTVVLGSSHALYGYKPLTSLNRVKIYIIRIKFTKNFAILRK